VLPSISSLEKSAGRLSIIRRMAGVRFAGKVYLVGGALRELAFGRTAKDYDFVVEQPEDLKAFEGIFGSRSFLLGKKPFQTFRIARGETVIDVTILDSGIEADLLRRDFTMNAMAFDLGRRALIDPLNGWEDMKKRIIRYPRKESLKDDPLRMVKAVRHLSMLRGFTIAPELAAAIAAERTLIRNAAKERVKYELDLILLSRDAHRGIEALAATGLLFEIFPELLSLQEMDKEKDLEPKALGHTLGGFKYAGRARRFFPLDEKAIKQVGYALLFHDLGKARTYSRDEEKGRVHFFHHERLSKEIAESIMERLRFSASETRAVSALIESHMRLFLISNEEASERATRRLVYKMEELTPSLVHLTLLDLYGSSKGKENGSTRGVRKRCREVLSAYEEWRQAPLPRIVTGHDLMALGFAEGPGLGHVLEEIREKQIAGEICRKEEALKYAAERRET